MFAMFLLLGGSLMALLTLIQFSPILSFQRGALLRPWHSWFFFTIHDGENTAQKQPTPVREMGACFGLFFFIKEKSCLCPFPE